MLNKSVLRAAFISTMWQYLLFKILFALYSNIFFILRSYTITAWDTFVLYFLIPFVCGCLWCTLLNRKNFQFQIKNTKATVSIRRLSVRTLTVVCFIVCGYLLEISFMDSPELLVNSLAKIKLNNDFILDLVFRFPPYILTAIFPMSFAVTEWFFKAEVQE